MSTDIYHGSVLNLYACWYIPSCDWLGNDHFQMLLHLTLYSGFVLSGNMFEWDLHQYFGVGSHVISLH